MTAIIVSLLLLASSCFANTVAVSWEYYPHSINSFEVDKAPNSPKTGTHSNLLQKHPLSRTIGQRHPG